MRELWKGNEAIAEAAIRAGVDAYFGYPITPQTELLEYMARRMPELGRVFVQAESEIAAINMVYGAACTGIRAMSSSSSPGISLMQEGLSYIAASEVPCVVVDMMRGGPGLGNIQPGQSDYFQITRSAGHGDYHMLVFAPATIQEAVDLTYSSFDLAMRYRTIVMLAADGALGQMMEPVQLPAMCNDPPPAPEWALTGARGREAREISSLQLAPEALEEVNVRLQEKLARIAQAEVRYEEYLTDDAEILVVAFGTVARIARSAVRTARQYGHPRRALPPDYALALSRGGAACPQPPGDQRAGGGDERRANGRGCAALRVGARTRALPRAHGRDDSHARRNCGRTLLSAPCAHQAARTLP